MTENTKVIFKYKVLNSDGKVIKEVDEGKQTKNQNKKTMFKATCKKALKNILNTNKTKEKSNNSKIKNKINNDKITKNNNKSKPQDNSFWKLSYTKKDNKSDKKVTHNTNSKDIKKNNNKNKSGNKNSNKNKLQTYTKKMKEDIRLAQKKAEFLNNWEKTMTYTGLFNEMHETFSPNDLKFTKYGAEARLIIPWGYNYKDLKNVRETLQNNLQCTVVLNTYVNENYVDAKFIYIESCNKIKFKPVPAKPYELFLGVDESGNPILVDINSEPHVLVAGSTRNGKNGTLDHAITNLIYNCNEKEVNIYLMQGAKGDLAKYRNCKQVTDFMYIDDNDKVFKFIDYINNEMNKRKRLFMPMIDKFQDPNLKNYNKKNPNEKLPYIYVFIDELMAISAKAIKESKGVCSKIIDLLERIAQYGGAYGITYVVSHQKPQRQLLSTFVKNMSNVRVCYGFPDSVCSAIVLGDGRYEAVDLPPRKAYVICKAYEGYLYTLDLENSIYKYVKDSIVKKSNNNDNDSDDKDNKDLKIHNIVENANNNKKKTNNIELNQENVIDNGIKQLQKRNKESKSLEIINNNPTKANNKQNKPNINYIKNDFSKVHPKTKEELLQENISKIYGYVPYVPPVTKSKEDSQ